jgi:hypothetical protein
MDFYNAFGGINKPIIGQKKAGSYEPAFFCVFSYRPLVCRGKPTAYFIPIHNIPKSRDVVGAPVLVLQVIGMLPNVQSQNRDPMAVGHHIHQRVILIGCAANR